MPTSKVQRRQTSFKFVFTQAMNQLSSLKDSILMFKSSATGDSTVILCGSYYNITSINSSANKRWVHRV